MSVHHKTPSELVDFLLTVAEEKGKKECFKLAILGLFAGALIALGGVANIVSSSTLLKSDPGAAKVLGASVFPVGLILVVTLGTELFTGNVLMGVGFVNKNINLKSLLRNWIIVYIFNYVGSVIIAYITAKTGAFNPDSQAFVDAMAHGKIEASAYVLFLKGILCNVLVCSAVILAYMSRDTIGKLVGAWLPIMLFVLIGYDHSVANMFYLNVAKMFNPTITYAGIFYNLFYVTLGNIVGGLFIGLSLYVCYYKKENKLEK